MVPAAAEEKAELSSPSPSIGLGGGGGKITTILTAVNTLATMAMIGVLFISFQKEKSKQGVEDIVAHVPEDKDAKKEPGNAKDGESAVEKRKSIGFGKMVTLERFTVNLATPGSANPKYVQVNISLELPTDDSESEVNMKMPQVRNVIIDLFNSKRPSDLATPEGRDYIKEEIRNALNGFLVTGKVKGVFFTNFALSS